VLRGVALQEVVLAPVAAELELGAQAVGGALLAGSPDGARTCGAGCRRSPSPIGRGYTWQRVPASSRRRLALLLRFVVVFRQLETCLCAFASWLLHQCKTCLYETSSWLLCPTCLRGVKRSSSGESAASVSAPVPVFFSRWA